MKLKDKAEFFHKAEQKDQDWENTDSQRINLGGLTSD